MVLVSKLLTYFPRHAKKWYLFIFPQKLFIQFSECNLKCLTEKKGGGFELKKYIHPWLYIRNTNTKFAWTTRIIWGGRVEVRVLRLPGQILSWNISPGYKYPL